MVQPGDPPGRAALTAFAARGDDVVDEGLDQGGEGKGDHQAHGDDDQVALHQEVLEAPACWFPFVEVPHPLSRPRLPRVRRRVGPEPARASAGGGGRTFGVSGPNHRESAQREAQHVDEPSPVKKSTRLALERAANRRADLREPRRDPQRAQRRADDEPRQRANEVLKAAKALLALPSKIRPPAAAATPGTIQPGGREVGGTRARRALHAPSTRMLTPPERHSRNASQAMPRLPFVADRVGVHLPGSTEINTPPRRGITAQEAFRMVWWKRVAQQPSKRSPTQISITAALDAATCSWVGATCRLTSPLYSKSLMRRCGRSTAT